MTETVPSGSRWQAPKTGWKMSIPPQRRCLTLLKGWGDVVCALHLSPYFIF